MSKYFQSTLCTSVTVVNGFLDLILKELMVPYILGVILIVFTLRKPEALCLNIDRYDKMLIGLKLQLKSFPN